MTVDDRGRRAAQSVWAASVDVDVEAGLVELHRTVPRRGARWRTVAGASVLVAALAVAVATFRPLDDARPEPPSPMRPGLDSISLGPGYEVLGSDVTPGGLQAVATLRQGQAAVVLVGRSGSDQQRVVWSAETPQELVRENPARPVAVAWAPGGQGLAVLIARPPYGEDSAAEELTLLTVDADGSDRREVPADLGPCSCAGSLPSLTWSTDGRHITVVVPQDSGGPSHDVVAVP